MSNIFTTIPSGSFKMGTVCQEGFATDLETGSVDVALESFQIKTTTVTNREFKAFVVATDYITDAEKFGWSSVFHLLIPEEDRLDSLAVRGMEWWLIIKGACWHAPEGPGSSIDGRLDHPVVHVSRNDALAYCRWEGSRLPTEAQWEYAAQGGLEQKRYPWGDNLLIDGKHPLNIWQGQFPISNTEEDGYLGTAPANNYIPNGYGLHQMVGNVWEWCLNPGKIPLDQFQKHTSEDFFNYFNRSSHGKLFAIRGGSFLCHDSYCNRYRVGARNSVTDDSSASNIGFRTLKPL